MCNIFSAFHDLTWLTRCEASPKVVITYSKMDLICEQEDRSDEKKEMLQLQLLLPLPLCYWTGLELFIYYACMYLCVLGSGRVLKWYNLWPFWLTLTLLSFIKRLMHWSEWKKRFLLWGMSGRLVADRGHYYLVNIIIIRFIRISNQSGSGCRHNNT